ncbi:putative kinesin motor domain superfamily [Helianthus anomalus]
MKFICIKLIYVLIFILIRGLHYIKRVHGTMFLKGEPNRELPYEATLIPRVVKQIFDTLEQQNAEYSVKVTFLELFV